MSHFARGARVMSAREKAELERAFRAAKAAAELVAAEPAEIRSAAAGLAYANKHKPWARRWLRQNGRFSR